MPTQSDAERCLLWAAEWQQIADNAESAASRECFENLARARERLASSYARRDEIMLTDWLGRKAV